MNSEEVKIGNLLSKLADFWRRHPDLNPLRGLGPQSGPSLSQSNMGSDISNKKPATRAGFLLEAPPRFELGNRGFAVRCLTTWLWRHMQPCTNRADINGAGNEARTRYLHLGKVALYRMSYARMTRLVSDEWCLRPESNWRHADFQSAALPTELPRQP